MFSSSLFSVGGYIFSQVGTINEGRHIATVREEGVRHYVLCVSFAPRCATMRDDFSAVMLLLGREKPTGGKVDEGHRWASGAEDGTGRAIRR